MFCGLWLKTMDQRLCLGTTGFVHSSLVPGVLSYPSWGMRLRGQKANI